MGTSHLQDPSFPVVDDVGFDQGYLTSRVPRRLRNPRRHRAHGGHLLRALRHLGPVPEELGLLLHVPFRQDAPGRRVAHLQRGRHRPTRARARDRRGRQDEVVPFFANSSTFQQANLPSTDEGPLESDLFPGQQSQPYGSTFVHHHHGALQLEDYLRVSGHYMSSWSPDDNTNFVGGEVAPARLTVVGGDVHYDRELYNAYLGYAHLDANNVYPLADALQTIHSGTGRSLKLNYFGQKDRYTGLTPSNFSGTVDTLMWQLMLRVAPLIGDPFGSRDFNVAFYGMYNHAVSPKEDPNDPTSIDIDDEKLKFGADLDLSLLKFMSIGARFDRVIPRLADTSDAYTAISPRFSLLHEVEEQGAGHRAVHALLPRSQDCPRLSLHRRVLPSRPRHVGGHAAGCRFEHDHAHENLTPSGRAGVRALPATALAQQPEPGQPVPPAAPEPGAPPAPPPDQAVPPAATEAPATPDTEGPAEAAAAPDEVPVPAKDVEIKSVFRRR